MWRRGILVCLVLSYKHILSQPVTDDITNDRPTRQLDFEECCPCFDKIDGGRDEWSQEPVAAAAEDVLARSRDLADCPCWNTAADAQGASSIFFPTAMRTAGNVLRPVEKKEELKPLFNPEVDLASSVLQTLREVTDAEYQDALARDAAKSAAKAAEDMFIGDPIPQESANIVTIVVNPALADDDDVMPQESHIQRSRCIHPLQSSVGKMRMAAKPNLFKYKPRLTKIKPPILHKKHFLDNGLGASNVYEHIVPLSKDPSVLNTDISPLRVLDSLNEEVIPSNNDANDNCETKVPDFRLTSDKKNMLGLNKSPLLHSLKNKIDDSVSRIPKKLSYFSPKKTRKDNDDLSSEPSNTNEQITKKLPYFKTYSLLENIRQNSSPFSITNLLNLKDVEIIPAKDLIKNIEYANINKPKLMLPSVLGDSEQTSNNDCNHLESKENSEVSKNYDTEGSASEPKKSFITANIQVPSKNEQTVDNNSKECLSTWKSDTNAKQSDSRSTKVLNTLPDSIDDLAITASTEGNDCIDNEKPNQTAVIGTSTNINDVIDDSIDDLAIIASTEGNDCIDNEKPNQDEIIDTKANSNDIIEQQDTNLENDDNSFENQNKTTDGARDEHEKDTSTKLLDRSLVDKTLSNIKGSIAKKLENIKTSIINKDILNRKVFNNVEDNKEIAKARTENCDQDSQNDMSMQVTTLSTLTADIAITSTMSPTTIGLIDNSEVTETLKRDSSNNLGVDTVDDNREDASKCSETVLSLQDLQKMSDSMLQEEQNRESKNNEYDEYSNVVTTDSSKNRVETWPDLDKSASSLAETVVKTVSTNNFREENNNEETCKNNLALPKFSQSQNDASVDASKIVLNSISKSNDILSSQPILQPAQDLIKEPLSGVKDLIKLSPLEPLPIIEDIKDKLTDLFDKENRDVDETSQLRSTSNVEDSLNPVMTPAASTSTFQSRLPPFRALDDVNFKRLELKPKPSILSEIPKIGIQSYKTKLPLPKDLSLKPINMHSPFNNKNNFLSPHLPTGKLGGRVKNNKYDIQPRDKPDNILKKPLDIRPKKGYIMNRLSNSPLEPIDDIHSTLKNTQKAFEASLKQVAKNNFNSLSAPIKKSSNLLESLSRNQGDVSDKLKGLQMDLNDRLETMRNEFIDRTRLPSRFRNSKPISNIGSLNNSQQPSKYTWQSSSRRNSQKISTPRKLAQTKPAKTILPSKSEKKHTFRMPGAASVPVPSTIQVPKLKSTSENSPLTLGRGPSSVPKFNTGMQQTPEFAEKHKSIAIQSTKPLLRKQLNTKKDSKIIVTFSTTPRPAVINNFRNTSPQLQKSNTIKNHAGFASPMTNEDDYQPLNDIKMLSNSNLNSQKYVRTGPENDLLSRKSGLYKEEKLHTPDMEKLSTKSTTQSWPTAKESSFLTKVKEAVEKRLSKVNSSKTLKQTNFQDNQENDYAQASEAIDMSRSASENKAIIDGKPLKENVSYKCRMVCTKE